MHDPVGFFLTWVTYGTWLPGDSRGWIEYRRGWQLPDLSRELDAASWMNGDACVLDRAHRNAVAEQIVETCLHTGWQLHAVNCRTNHLHVVVSASEVTPKTIRARLKAWTTRRLKNQFDAHREDWWAERGSIRWLWDDDDLAAAVGYVKEGQDRR